MAWDVKWLDTNNAPANHKTIYSVQKASFIHLQLFHALGCCQVQKFMSFSQLGPQSVCFQLVANMLAKNRAQETVDSMWRRVSLRFQEKQQQMQLQQQHG